MSYLYRSKGALALYNDTRHLVLLTIVSKGTPRKSSVLFLAFDSPFTNRDIITFETVIGKLKAWFSGLGGLIISTMVIQSHIPQNPFSSVNRLHLGQR
ncbi:hypothetical protein DESC_970010 [Desulfosarcina cetonica]|nr:hypothetical protein DESC_970010 [Desulfosarcina cetonica]